MQLSFWLCRCLCCCWEKHASGLSSISSRCECCYTLPPASPVNPLFFHSAACTCTWDVFWVKLSLHSADIANCVAGTACSSKECLTQQPCSLSSCSGPSRTTLYTYSRVLINIGRLESIVLQSCHRQGCIPPIAHGASRRCTVLLAEEVHILECRLHNISD